MKIFHSHRKFPFYLLILIFIVYLILDYRGPSKIKLRSDLIFGMACYKAKNLLVQEFDNDGNLWATRGMLIYCLKKGDVEFTKIARVPIGISVSWLNNLTIIRRIANKSENIEMTVTSKGHICAFSSGQMWDYSMNDIKFRKTGELIHYGFRKGRGILNSGLVNVYDSSFIFGEYFRNTEHTSVKIYQKRIQDLSWKAIYVFQPGDIKHIHSIQKDPYSDCLWVCTGDLDNEAFIGWSNDYFKSINPIGQGSQMWRVCQLVFTEDMVYWGTDAGIAGNYAGIYCWNKKNNQLTKLCKIDGVIMYGTRLSRGTIIFSMEREGVQNEKDNFTRLIIRKNNGSVFTIKCGQWKRSFFNKLIYSPARLRLQRNQGSNSLAFSCLNIKNIPQSELILIKEDTVLDVLK